MTDRVHIAGVGVAEGDMIKGLSPTWETGPAPQISVTLTDRSRVLQNSPLLYGERAQGLGKTPLGDIITAEHAGTRWVAVSLTPGDSPVIVLEHWIASTLRGRRGPFTAAKTLTRSQVAKGLLSLQGQADWRTVAPEANGHKPPVLDAPYVSQVKAIEKERDVQRAPGFAASASFKIGWPAASARSANADQKRVLATAMSVADDLNAPVEPRDALICALSVETAAKNLTGGDASSSGPLQLLASTARGLGVSPRDVAAVCRLFLTTGFWRHSPKGAIELSRLHPDWSVGKLAQECQGSAFPERYDNVAGQAATIRKAWSGSNTATEPAEETKSSFDVAADQTFWEASGTLADEVNRRRFIASNDTVYWIAESDLAKSRAYATVSPYDTGCKLQPGALDELLNVEKLTVQLLLPQSACGDVIGRNIAVVDYGPSSGTDWLSVKATRSGLGDRWISVDLERARNPLKKAATTSTATPVVGRTSMTTRPASETRGITTDGGARGIVSQIADLCRQVGGSTIFVGSDYRPGSITSSGNLSDHSGNDANRAARDIGKRGTDLITGPPTPEMDKAVAAVCEALGVHWTKGTTLIHTFTWKGYRLQLIWRTPKYGGHQGHLHCGAHKL